jgi:hypothetical protein
VPIPGSLPGQAAGGGQCSEEVVCASKLPACQPLHILQCWRLMRVMVFLPHNVDCLTGVMLLISSRLVRDDFASNESDVASFSDNVDHGHLLVSLCFPEELLVPESAQESLRSKSSFCTDLKPSTFLQKTSDQSDSDVHMVHLK